MPKQPNCLKEVKGERCSFFRKRILVQAQWRSGKRRRHIWARCRSLTQGRKPIEWKDKARTARKECHIWGTEEQEKKICWKPWPPNKLQAGAHKGSLLLWASGCDTWIGCSFIFSSILTWSCPEECLQQLLTRSLPLHLLLISKNRCQTETCYWLFTFSTGGDSTSNDWDQLVILALGESQILPVSKEATAHH